MTATRRTILGVMGMAPMGVGAEAFVEPAPRAGEVQTTIACTSERCAIALEALAVELRRGSIDLERMAVLSSMEPDQIANRHELRVFFVHKPEV